MATIDLISKSTARFVSAELGDLVAGVIFLDSVALMWEMKTNAPHGLFCRSNDMFGAAVGNPNTNVLENLRAQKTIPSTLTAVISASDTENY